MVKLNIIPMQDYMFVKLDKKFSKIFYSDIIYAEAVKKYVRIITTRRAYLILASMSSVEKILPQNQFCRIHRSYIISLNHITDFDNELVYIGNKILPIGRQHRGTLQERVVILSDEMRLDSNRDSFDSVIPGYSA
jgi:DNA-binding LytR/AlgR family response regulator